MAYNTGSRPWLSGEHVGHSLIYETLIRDTRGLHGLAGGTGGHVGTLPRGGRGCSRSLSQNFRVGEFWSFGDREGAENFF